MTKRAAVFIPESGPEIGMGHVYRLISMAQMLESTYYVSFLVSGKAALEIIRRSGFDGEQSSFDDMELLRQVEPGAIAVLDGYHFTADLFDSFREKGIATMYLDDFAEDFPPADIVLNTADLTSVPEIPTPFSQYVSGHRYILLRKEFLKESAEKKDPPAFHRMFICLGATDPGGLTLPLIRQISGQLPEMRFTILCGSMNSRLADLSALQHATVLTDANAAEVSETIRQCDIAIVSASNIAQECIATGIPLACIQTADNQHNLYSALVEHHLCYPLGNAQTFSVQVPSLLQALNDPERWKTQILNQQNWIDGKSGDRIRSLAASLELGIRDVQQKDSALLLAWKNDPVSLENSFHSFPVTQEEHEKWFGRELENERAQLYLVTLRNQPVSLVRFSTHTNRAVIGITVGPEFRGQRFAARSLVLACIRYFRLFPQNTVEAYIKIENVASVKAFRSAGFRLCKGTEVNGIPALLLTKTSNGELPKEAGFC